MSEKVIYDAMLARSFSKHEQKKLGYGALLASLFIAFSFFAFLNPHLHPLPIGDMRITTGVGLMKVMQINETTSSYKEAMKSNNTQKSHLNQTILIDNNSNHTHNTNPEIVMLYVHGKKMKNNTQVCTMEARSDFCEVKDGEVRIDGKSSTVSFTTSKYQSETGNANSSWLIKPYARKGDIMAMSLVREWSVAKHQEKTIHKCSKKHSVPAILFSTGGYSRNNFHDFTDILIPLYLTSRRFNGEVKFLVTDIKHGWIKKFEKIIRMLSSYDVIDIDKEEGTHCFIDTTVIVGLKRHHGDKELTSDPVRSSYSMKDFRHFLRRSYSLRNGNALKLTRGKKRGRKPRLLVISRKRSRTFMNTNEISRMASQVGFEVIVSEAANMKDFAEVVNSCDVMMGVHGAGITNMVFLPDNAVVIQILPIGGFEWLAKTYFGEPSKSMKLRYLDYSIRPEESSLIEEYSADDKIMRIPFDMVKEGWEAFKSIYLDKQNVNLDVNRFRPTLLKALNLLYH